MVRRRVTQLAILVESDSAVVQNGADDVTAADYRSQTQRLATATLA